MENNTQPTPAPASKSKSGSGRNSEKRRERSKVAARCRRSQESEIFTELAEFLPLPENTRNSLDKASVMRLSLSDLKLKHMMEKVFSECGRGSRQSKGTVEDLESEVDSLVNNAMGGFLLVLSTDGDIIYVSESITAHLGISQVEVMGHSIYDFSHPCDHGDIKELLSVNKKEEDEEEVGRSSCFRMKCTITARGRNVHLRAASYKVIDFKGRIFTENENDATAQWFIGVGEPLFHPSDVDIPLNKQTFLTKHSPDMKCEFVDDSIGSFLGYRPEDLVGNSIFEFHHAADGPGLAKAFKSLFVKGQSVTERYRFVAKHGGWAWVITQATLIQSSSGSKPNSIVCLNFVTSGIENEHEIISSMQRERPACKPFDLVMPDFKNPPFVFTKMEDVLTDEACEKENILPEIISDSEPITSTKTVIAPRTDDMDSGFLMPCNDSLIVSKGEPEDLTHLAPIAGDACVPLNMRIPLLDDILKEFQQSNVPYTFDGQHIEVSFDDLQQDDLPQLEQLISPSRINSLASSPAHSEFQNEEPHLMSVESSISLTPGSPLFLNSDPHMVSSPGSRSSLMSPFQLSPAPQRRRNCDGDGSMFDTQPSPCSTIGYDADTRSPLPALIGLNLDEDPYSRIVIDSPLSVTGPSAEGSTSKTLTSGVSELTGLNCLGNISDFNGQAFMASDDERKFPMVSESNLNEFLWPVESNASVSTAPMIEKIVDKSSVPYFFDGKCGNPSSSGKQCDYIAMDCKPDILHSQMTALSKTPEVFNGVMKGGGGESCWNWNSVIVRKSSEKLPSTIIKTICQDYRIQSPSIGPTVAKQAKLSGSAMLSSLPAPSNRSSVINCSTFDPGVSVAHSGVNMPGVIKETALLTQCQSNFSSQMVTGKATKLLPVDSSPEPSEEVAETDDSVLGYRLKTCLQKLLQRGENGKVKEIINLLQSSKSQCNDQQTEDNFVKEEKGVVGSMRMRKSSPFNLVQLQQQQQRKSIFSCNRKRDNHGFLLATGSSYADGTELSQFPLPSLNELTRHDCEVNAPLCENSCLLTGADLLTALETDGTEDPYGSS